MRNAFLKYLYFYIQAQLIVTLVSIPICVAWGLGISIMSFVGNFIYPPLFMLFLFLSSLLFFTELLYVPNSLIAWSLEQTTSLILKLLGYYHTSWLFYFVKPPFIVLILMVIGTIAIVRYSYSKKSGNSTYLAYYLIIIVMFLWIFSCLSRNVPLNLTRGSSHLTIHLNSQSTGDRKVVIEDFCYLGRVRNPEKWVCYTLTPQLAKNYGTRTIENLIVHKLTNGTIATIEAIAAFCLVKQITISSSKQPSKKMQSALTQLAANLPQNIIVTL